MLSFLRSISHDFRDMFYILRARIIIDLWKPINTNLRPRFLRNFLNKFWAAPTSLINMTGDNSDLDLTDETIAYDLPFLLAESNPISELNLSNNQLGPRTISFLHEQLHIKANIHRPDFPNLLNIKSLNLSHNAFNSEARNLLPSLVSLPLKKIDLSDCGLSAEDINKLIATLEKNSSLTKLKVSPNEATPDQLRKISDLIKRNRCYEEFSTKRELKNTLDLQSRQLGPKSMKALAFYITKKAAHFWEPSSRIKEIKAPILGADVRDRDFEAIIEALKKNNDITNFTTNFIETSREVKQKIRTQLMLNKAYQKAFSIKPEHFLVIGKWFSPSLIITWAIFEALGIANPIHLLHIILPLSVAIIGSITCNLLLKRLRQACSDDYNRPENIAAIKRGKDAVHSWVSYLNPKSYTPMAYLGYAIEKNQLHTKYGVKDECFKSRPHALRGSL